MSTDNDRRLVEILARSLRELRELEEAGRLRDAASQAEIAFLEQELRVAEGRVAGAARDSREEGAGVPGHASACRRSEGERLPNQDP